MTDKELLQKYEAYCFARWSAALYLLGAYELWEKNDEIDTWFALIQWGHCRTQCNHILDSLNYRDYDRLCDLAGSIV
jgi:hypothetical protein